MLHNRSTDNGHSIIVFSSQLDPPEPRVSGVGLNYDPDYTFYVVPSGYDERWDRQDYQFPATDELPLMRQHPYNGRHGFIFHAVCYSLLREFFDPEEVPVARLLEVCKSFPFQPLGLSWGHDYGGIFRVDQESHYPWDGQNIDAVELAELAREPADPLDIPELRKPLQKARRGRQTKRARHVPTLTPTGGTVSSNHFTRLPFELLEDIVTRLPTNEVGSLSRTSRELAMIIPFGLGQSFWASRFRTPFELGCIFEVKDHRDRLDWRELYFGIMKTMRCSLGLQNRKRIWDLLRSPLSELACMYWTDNSALCPLDTDRDQPRRKEVCGDLQPLVELPGTGKWSVGCKRFRTQRASIPSSLRQIRVSTISIGNATYVTGFRFILCEGLDVYLGYAKGRDESSLNPADQFVDTTSVQGLILAVGSRGIQAVQFITCAGQLSHWFGCPDGLPKTRRLGTFKHVTAIEAGFDVRTPSSLCCRVVHKACQGFKMVSLAIVKPPQPCLEGPADKAELLRNSALWFPEVPGNHLYLNETSFKSTHLHASGFRPLCYTIFGGSGGICLQSLIKISVLSRGNGVTVINFYYNNGSIQRLGRQRLRRSAYDTSCFLVDGAQGEVIQTIEIDFVNSRADPKDVKTPWEHGRLRSFKVSHYFPDLGLLIRAVDAYVIPRTRVSCRYLPIKDDRNISDPKSVHQNGLARCNP